MINVFMWKPEVIWAVRFFDASNLLGLVYGRASCEFLTFENDFSKTFLHNLRAGLLGKIVL